MEENTRDALDFRDHQIAASLKRLARLGFDHGRYHFHLTHLQRISLKQIVLLQ